MNDLQTTLENFEPGDVWLHAAAHGHLNTMFVLNCAAFWSHSGWNVTLISSELSPSWLHSKMPEEYWRGGILFRDPGDWQALLDRTLYIPRHDRRLVVVDHLQGFVRAEQSNYWDGLTETFNELRDAVLPRPGCALMTSFPQATAADRTRTEPLEKAVKRKSVIDSSSVVTIGRVEVPHLHVRALKARRQEPFEVVLKTDLLKQKIHLVDSTTAEVTTA